MLREYNSNINFLNLKKKSIDEKPHVIAEAF